MLNDLRTQFGNGTSVSKREQQWNLSPRSETVSEYTKSPRKRQRLNDNPSPFNERTLNPQSFIQQRVTLGQSRFKIPPTPHTPEGFTPIQQTSPQPWLTDPSVFPDTEIDDIFGQISWEALFQDDGFGLGLGQEQGGSGDWMSWDFNTTF